jgi:antitoxin PrlF
MSNAFPAKLTSKGQLTIPARLRAELKLRPGDQIKFIEGSDGRYWIEPVTASLAELKGVVRSGHRRFTGDEIAEMIARSRSARGEGLLPSKRKKSR